MPRIVIRLNPALPGGGRLALMVIVTGQLDGKEVRAEVHGPHDVRGDANLVRRAGGMVRRGDQVYAGVVLGGGRASFEDEWIATATLVDALDSATAQFVGLQYEAPAGAIFS